MGEGNFFALKIEADLLQKQIGRAYKIVEPWWQLFMLQETRKWNGWYPWWNEAIEDTVSRWYRFEMMPWNHRVNCGRWENHEEKKATDKIILVDDTIENATESDNLDILTSSKENESN
jgi:hypothetical protein